MNPISRKELIAHINTESKAAHALKTSMPADTVTKVNALVTEKMEAITAQQKILADAKNNLAAYHQSSFFRRVFVRLWDHFHVTPRLNKAIAALQRKHDRLETRQQKVAPLFAEYTQLLAQRDTLTEQMKTKIAEKIPAAALAASPKGTLRKLAKTMSEAISPKKPATPAASPAPTQQIDPEIQKLLEELAALEIKITAAEQPIQV